MAYTCSHLRYPGGKYSFSRFILSSLEANEIDCNCYLEPYAGGAGAALKLLFDNHIKQAHLNDIDYRVYCSWISIVDHTEEFCKLLIDCKINLDTWRKHKNIMSNPGQNSQLDVGFSTFFLNRCNHSGILYANPIGGLSQEGRYKIDARFNKANLVKKIEKIAKHRNNIHLSNLDAISFITTKLNNIQNKNQLLIYIDPPYFQKGGQLYLNHYKPHDHLALSKFLRQHKNENWILSYDNTPAISLMYSGFKTTNVSSHYFAHKARKDYELVVFSDNLSLPNASLAQ